MILAYHRVNPWYPDDALSVSPERFRQQIVFLLEKGWKAISPTYLLTEILLPKGKREKKWFLVTFDDGYADNLWYAWPVLNQLHVPVLIFLTAGYIGTRELMPRYKDRERDRFLTWQEAQLLSQEGAFFGSHSLSHRNLVELSVKEAEKEISASHVLLQERLKKKIEFFCYPYGAYNRTVISLVEKAGFQAGMVTGGSKMFVSPFTLPRVGIYSHNSDFVFRIKVKMGTWKEKRFFSFWQ